jgi:hypothetical protein
MGQNSGAPTVNCRLSTVAFRGHNGRTVCLKSTRLFPWALLVALAWPRPAAAYVRTLTSTGLPMYWNRTVLEIHAYTADPPPDLAAGDMLNAATAAAAAWSRSQVPCTSIELRVVDVAEASADVAEDGVARLTFRRDQWCKQPRDADEPCYDPSILAVTSVFARRSDGEILDADVEVNAVDYKWSDLVKHPELSGPDDDLQNTLTHEFGHFIGLDHTCVLDGTTHIPLDNNGRPVPSCARASEEVRESTMFADVVKGDTDRRTLSIDDINAVCAIYPTLDPVLQGDSSGCAAASGPRRSGGGAAAAAGAALALTAARRRRRGAPPRPARRSSTGPGRPS